MGQPTTKVPSRSGQAAQVATAPKTKVVVTAPQTTQKAKAPLPPQPPATKANPKH